ncbi:MAG: hypothetical protein H8E15_03240 [Planctomycetes bacterium]|nr:hypothetical protein [Planctomycetota bacterium]
MRIFTALLLALTLGSCASGNLRQLRWQQPPEAIAVEQLQPGMDLQKCLDLLGAPSSVSEADDVGGRRSLTWKWLQESGWNLSLSVPLSDSASASYQYGRNNNQIRHLQLIFDPAWQLLEIVDEGP